jgi:dihydroxyacetone kinase-like predicted kinase
MSTETIVQGVAALLAFNPEEDFKTNIQSMTEAMSTVKTIEIARATHSTRMNGLKIKNGQAIGILEGKLIIADDKIDSLLRKLLAGIYVHEASIITILLWS